MNNRTRSEHHQHKEVTSAAKYAPAAIKRVHRSKGKMGQNLYRHFLPVLLGNAIRDISESVRVREKEERVCGRER